MSYGAISLQKNGSLESFNNTQWTETARYILPLTAYKRDEQRSLAEEMNGSKETPEASKNRLEPINLDVKSAAAYLGISWRYLDEIKCKKLDPASNKLVRYINHGKRVLFPIDELKRYNEQLKQSQWSKS